VLVDVRPASEFDSGHIPTARSIPLGELAQRVGELPRDEEIIAYCRGPFCALGDDAVRLLRDHGFQAVRLEDGFPEWVLAGAP
jgi:rhodanese-related sulfurtransferase